MESVAGRKPVDRSTFVVVVALAVLALSLVGIGIAVGVAHSHPPVSQGDQWMRDFDNCFQIHSDNAQAALDCTGYVTEPDSWSD